MINKRWEGRSGGQQKPSGVGGSSKVEEKLSVYPFILDLKIPEWKTSKANTSLINSSLTLFSKHSTVTSN